MNPMRNDNPFKLGLFSTNADGGLAFTRVEERWRASWSEIEKMARLADAAGLEFILPIARWKGYGGETDVRGASFETLTHGAALAAVTKRIAIFSTVHVPLVHPVFAAKALATIDHVSGGRAGLNIVCGWNQSEFDMFGHRQPEHDTRYDQGFEWFEIMLRIFAGGDPFDFKGKFYDLKGVTGGPPPVQLPRPFTMSAAYSPAGRRFAAQTSDILFTPLREPERTPAQIAEFRTLAQAAGREVGVFTACHIVCRETDAEAERYYKHYADDMADVGAVDFHMAAKRAHYGKIDDDVYRIERRRYAGGTGTHALIGSPERVADGLVRMQALGFAGTSMSFVNFNDELPFFTERVLPLLEQAGLRRTAPSAVAA
jgi:alkanesulfonate monooxygenase SsuD/methylene tetrahydromethanopterin reductase-like flavin-dependent oxidoreductase (luciferase family)